MLTISTSDTRTSNLSTTQLDCEVPPDQTRKSPIHRLPPEILGIIFCHTLPTNPEFVEPSVRTAPLLLCRVSKHWRELAERTPELWSSISLFLLRPDEHATRAFGTWIARSGNCPLRIKLVVLAYTSEARVHTQDPLRGFIPYVASQSYRWLAADIAVPGCLMQILLANNAPMLRSLTLSDPLAESQSDSSCNWEHTFALSAAPALSHLVLKQRVRILPSTTNHITCVQFDAFSATQVIDLFNGCPFLVELGITFKREILLLGGPDVWTFPRLHALRISLHHSNARGESSAILDRLRLPVLHTLAIDGLRQAHGIHLSTLLDRTCGALVSLALLNISTSHSDLFEYLHRAPMLRSLRLVDSHGFDQRCVRRLTWLPGWQTNLCSHLSEVWLLRSECQTLPVEVVENMVVSRSSEGNARSDHPEVVPDPLREFRFDGSKSQHEELLSKPRIQSAIENGLIWKR